MNYLAHLSLAYPDPGLIAGNYIVDLITRKEEQDIHPSFKQGVLFHRWIDHFSNNSKPLSEINSAFHNLIHKYAPVATDIICDYLLCLSWQKHFDISLNEFFNYNYHMLSNFTPLMPERISLICRSMIQHRWLEQYQTIEGIEQVLKRTNQKARFSVDLTAILPVLIKEEKAFTELFNLFYTDCQKQGMEWISLQNGEKM